MNIVAFRALTISTIFLSAAVGSALPFYLSARWPRLLGLLNAGAAGVFLAAALVHLLDDAEQNPGLSRWSSVDGGRYAFPWAPAFCLAGFLLLVFVGELARCVASSAVRQEGLSQSLLNEGENKDDSAQGAYSQPRRRSVAGVNAPSPASAAVLEQGGLTAVVVYAALSVHSVLAGLGLGAAGDSSKSAWGIYIAIMCHKGLAAFALASNFASLHSRPSRCTIVLTLFSFACMTPAGMALGWGLIAATKDADPDDSATTGILSALASGTFLYVSTMELLPDALERARRPGGSRVLTNIAIGVGATAFASLAKWT